MPAIPVPPTQKNVTEEIISGAMRCTSTIQLEHNFLKVDQAIYNKVLQVLFNQKTRDSSFCNEQFVQTGGFHMVLCFLKTICSHFYDSWIVKLLAETEVSFEDSIRSAMKGSDVVLNQLLQNPV